MEKWHRSVLCNTCMVFNFDVITMMLCIIEKKNAILHFQSYYEYELGGMLSLGENIVWNLLACYVLSTLNDTTLSDTIGSK